MYCFFSFFRSEKMFRTKWSQPKILYTLCSSQNIHKLLNLPLIHHNCTRLLLQFACRSHCSLIKKFSKLQGHQNIMFDVLNRNNINDGSGKFCTESDGESEPSARRTAVLSRRRIYNTIGETIDQLRNMTGYSFIRIYPPRYAYSPLRYLFIEFIIFLIGESL